MDINDLDIAVLAVGNPDYAVDALPVIRDYCNSHHYRMTVVADTLDFTPPHPSWLKLTSARMFPAARFVLWWDLDLLPVRGAPPIHDRLDGACLNAAVDCSLMRGYLGYNKNFRYNMGLVGVPVGLFDQTLALYSRSVPGDRPSYEQYYVNDWIAETGQVVNEIDVRFNTHWCSEYATPPFCIHYTGMGYNIGSRCAHIAEHRAGYFQGTGSPTPPPTGSPYFELVGC